jgi:hypothetical protein
VITQTKATPVVIHLQRAAEHIRLATTLVDHNEPPCPHCGRRTYVAKQLDAMLYKLGKLADELARKATPQGGNNA